MLWSSSGRKWKLVRGLFIFIAAHKSSLVVAGSRYLPPEVAAWLLVGRPLTALQCSRPTPGDSLPPIPRTNFHFRPEEDQSIWSKRRQGFQPCYHKPLTRELSISCPNRLRSSHFNTVYARSQWGSWKSLV